MRRTISEQIFEKQCTRLEIVWRRVPESDSRTPDYELVFDATTVVVEVKEITPNAKERESYGIARERGYGNVLGGTPGDRVRKKITECSAQIKARTAEKHPSMLVVFDRGRFGEHIDPYCIRVAMYGLEQIYITVPPIGLGEPHATGIGHGPKRKMTANCNTSISAIGALFMTGPDDIHFHVYHNRFAQI